MPGFKDFAQRAKDAGQQAAARVAQSIDDVRGDPDQPQPQDGEVAAADGGETPSVDEVRAEKNRLQSFLTSHRPVPGPVEGEWSIGIGGLLAEHPKVPVQMHGLARKLDRYGGLAISERGLTVDGDHAEWDSITEIRTRNVVDYLLSDGVVRALDTLPLPRFPGRKRLLAAVSEALMALLLAAAREQFDRGTDIRIPTEISFPGGLGRRRELSPSILATLILTDPAVAQCLDATATAHGTSICAADDEAMQTAEQRAAMLKAKLAALNARIRSR